VQEGGNVLPLDSLGVGCDGGHGFGCGRVIVVTMWVKECVNDGECGVLVQ
jgi:hypothetical protein